MYFIALLSGGKDSCFNIMKCIEHGHHLTCLANLMPNNEELEEIHSFMYQSAGHKIIPLYAECFEVPLYRKSIKGSAASTDMNYNSSPEDEVEDLYELLREIKTIHPEVQAVSCGAIVSNYQRVRVENVCIRLGLTPLTYLWMIDRSLLLHEIIDSDVNAILVKVAGAGLIPEKHLGKSLAELKPVLLNLNRKYGLDLCGEGGEYESLVLDCPLFKNKRIVLKKTSIVYDEEDISIGNLSIESAYLEMKTQNELKLKLLNLEKQVNSINSSGNNSMNHHHSHSLVEDSSASSEYGTDNNNNTNTSLFISPGGLVQSEVIYPSSSSNSSGLSVSDIVSNQLEDIFNRIDRMIRFIDSNKIVPSVLDSVMIHLYLSDMSFFSVVNNKYCTYFKDNPPSRCCIAIALPTGIHVAAEFKILLGSYNYMQQENGIQRKVLHIKSQSSWAPLCIGPYAQANVVLNELIFLAGQIALDPSTMSVVVVPPPEPESLQNKIKVQLIQSLKNVCRTLSPLQSSIDLSVVMVVYVNASMYANDSYQSKKELFFYIENMLKELICEEIKSRHYVFDVDSDINRKSDLNSNNCDDTDSQDDNEEEIIETIPMTIPIQLIGVEGIPRNSLIEIEVIALPATFNSRKERIVDRSTEIMHVEFDLEKSHVTCYSNLNSTDNMIHHSVYDSIIYTPNYYQPLLKPFRPSEEFRNYNLLPSDYGFDQFKFFNEFCYRLGCFSSGFSRVGLSIKKELFDDMDIMHLILCFNSALHEILHISKLKINSVLTIKIWCAPEYEHLYKRCNEQYFNKFWPAPIRPSFLLSSGLFHQEQDNDSLNICCVMQFLFVDLLQMRSETWINNM